MSHQQTVSCVLACALFFGGMAWAVDAPLAPAAAKPATTLDNLQAAFNGESNAHARYTAFAKKADEEGYLGVASLFRAAARAEQIHFNNHAAVIKKMGGAPKADIKLAEVKSTKENIEAAIKGETYERDTMYPDFIKAARAAGDRAAVRTFNFAKEAEAGHAKLYTDALAKMDSWKAAKIEFIICPECGLTTADKDLKECPTCSTPRKKFELVS